jgi:hypothetical protein
MQDNINDFQKVFENKMHNVIGRGADNLSPTPQIWVEFRLGE